MLNNFLSFIYLSFEDKKQKQKFTATANAALRIILISFYPIFSEMIEIQIKLSVFKYIIYELSFMMINKIFV